METHERDEEQSVRRILEALGLTVSRVAEDATEKRADFIVHDPIAPIIIEVKSKGDDPNEAERYDREVHQGALVHKSASMGKRSAMSAIVEAAARQLVATPAGRGALRVLWVVATGRYPELAIEQFKNTLYGIQILHFFPEADEEELPPRPCFYFDRHDFFRYPEIDAALVGDGVRGQLFLNQWSSHLEFLRATVLYEACHHAGAVIDPEALEREGKAFLADMPDVDRDDGAAVNVAVRKKYGLPMGPAIPRFYQSVTVEL